MWRMLYAGCSESRKTQSFLRFAFNGWENLSDQLFGSSTSYAPPPGLYEAAIGLSVELEEIELFGELPASGMYVVHSAVWVVLDDDRWCGRLS